MCNKNNLIINNTNNVIINSEDSANNYDDLYKLKFIDQIPNILVDNCCKLNDEDIQQYYNVNNLSRKSSVSHISNPVYYPITTTNKKKCLYDSCASLNNIYNNNNNNNILNNNNNNNNNRSRTPLTSAGSSSLDHSIITVTSTNYRPNYNSDSSCYSIAGTLTASNIINNNNNNNSHYRSHLNCNSSIIGSMSSVYEHNWDYNNKDSSCCTNMILTPSKITIEPMSSSSLCSDIPEYFNSPSRIKWNFLAGLDEREKLEDEDLHVVISRDNDDDEDNDDILRKQSPDIKTVSIWRTENDEANAIIFHHESEIVENCCNNYIQCNMYLDQNYTEEECPAGFCDFLSKTNANNNLPKLNNINNDQASSCYPASITISHRNDFTSENIRIGSPDFRRFQKRTNLNQNLANFTQNPGSSSSSSSNILTVLNKSTNTSVNNLNYNHNLEVNLNEDKHLNLLRNNLNQITNTNYLRTGGAVGGIGVGVGQSSNMLEPYNISSSQYEKPFYLTTQNQFYPYLNSDRRQSINLSQSSHNTNINNLNINHNNNINNNNINNNSINNMTPVQLQRWQSLTNTIGLGELMRIVRSRARKCAEYLRNDGEKK